MEQIHTVDKLLNFILLKKEQKKTVGLVPTMGSLHEGHDSLITRCRKENNITIVSIYVNPDQFNIKDDFINYPRDLNLDIQRLENLHCDVLFFPSDEEMAKIPNSNFKLKLGNLNKILEAAKRPGHFQGVINIVSKLFQIISPNKAYFGEKDLQQLLIIKQLCVQRFPLVKIINCSTITDGYGLAKSSRNKNLNEKELSLARSLYRVLMEIKKNKLKET